MKEYLKVDDETISSLILIITYVLTFSAIKVVLSTGNKRTLRKILIDVFVGAPVGITFGMLGYEYGFGSFTSATFAVLGVLLGENIILSIMASRSNAGKWLLGFVNKIIDNLINKYTK